MSSCALASRLLTRSRSTAVHTSRSRRARAASTTSTAPPSDRSSFFRLTALGFVSAAGAGTYVFLRDARAGAEELAALNERNPVGTTAKRERPLTPLSTLIRTYVVYSFCSVPALVDWAPGILAALSAVPGLKQVTEAVVRATFFNQFVGGDTAEDALPLIEELRAQNTGCLFAYSVEVDETEAAGHGPAQESRAVTSVHKQVVRETLHCIDVAADYEDKHTTGRTGRRTWVAIKLSAMVPDAESLRRLSQYLVSTRPRVNPPVAFPGCPLPTDLDVLSSPSVTGTLTQRDIAVLRELREDLLVICTRAQARGVRLIFDAEYSWYEPAIDAFTLDMMRHFNKVPQRTKKSSWFGSVRQLEQPSKTVQPLVYATYQAYLRRTPEYLAQSIAAARDGGYSLGVKLVRGAYHPHEVAAHSAVASSSDQSTHSLSISPDAEPPVWTEKADSDARYNACVRELIAAVRADVGNATPTIGVLFGTHNWESANLIVDELVRQGLGQPDAQGVVHVGDEVAERVTMGQLYGMTAALTNYLVDRIHSSSPFVIKYIPYGQLSEVMPYLSRRAIENKSVLGNGTAQEERRRAAAEIVARILR
ncbi:FAD-linked oxidoreductase [Polyporus arcularius HHB13444]|uniref:Proline dehydrogenase n=1 Tax=Polyporus arcularius HHB13444 TaxID=1314778 RepID=A0A5C3PIC3_9APHY|nr:FAD-linked oxidoreductase [Polyporus arcularius HHB13444]